MTNFEHDVIQRLERLETTLANHLASHSKVLWRLMVPMVLGIAVLLLRPYIGR